MAQYDVAIIGGGISGTALLYMLSRYTDLQRICIIEKYADFSQVNSHAKNNSQTLHCGDIETNYTLEKAKQVKQTAAMVVNYATSLDDFSRILFHYPKMVLAVGKDECDSLRTRYQTFKPHFPNMQLLESDAIAELEPALTDGRKQEIVAIAVTNEYSAVDYKALSLSFVEQAAKQDNAIDTMLNTKVNKVETLDDGHRLYTSQGEIDARFVVVSAGGHSLLFAQKQGYGMEYSCLPVAGSFYYVPAILKGKVYTMQNEKLPFAAIHGDPDVLIDGKTRMGPTALIVPLLERYRLRTFFEYLKVLHFDRHVLKVFWDLFKVSDIRNYMFKNVLFEIPLIRKLLFLRDARKITPKLKLGDLQFARKVGGVRPVMIDKNNDRLLLGEAKINPGNGLIFNMTPSPGATSCLGNAEKDMRIIADYLHCQVDEKALQAELYTPNSRSIPGNDA